MLHIQYVAEHGLETSRGYTVRWCDDRVFAVPVRTALWFSPHAMCFTLPLRKCSTTLGKLDSKTKVPWPSWPNCPRPKEYRCFSESNRKHTNTSGTSKEAQNTMNNGTRKVSQTGAYERLTFTKIQQWFPGTSVTSVYRLFGMITHATSLNQARLRHNSRKSAACNCHLVTVTGFASVQL